MPAGWGRFATLNDGPGKFAGLISQAALLQGGDSGAAVVPGDPEKSKLIEAVRYKNDDLKMPPKSGRLTAAQVSVLTLARVLRPE